MVEEMMGSASEISDSPDSGQIVYKTGQTLSSVEWFGRFPLTVGFCDFFRAVLFETVQPPLENVHCFKVAFDLSKDLGVWHK